MQYFAAFLPYMLAMGNKFTVIKELFMNYLRLIR